MDIVEGKLNDVKRVLLRAEVPTWEDIIITGEKLINLAFSSSAFYKDEFYIIGGESITNCTVNSIYKFNPLNNVLQKIIIKDLPEISNHSCIAGDNGIYLFGGYIKGNYNNSLLLIKPEDKTYEVLFDNVYNVNYEDNNYNSKIPIGRINSSIEILNSYIYMYGGKSKEGVYLDDMWKFSLNNKEWIYIDYKNNSNSKLNKDSKEECQMFPKGRSGHTMTEYKGYLYIFGGRSGIVFENNDFWKFNIQSETFYLIQDTLLELHQEEQIAVNSNNATINNNNKANRKSNAVNKSISPKITKNNSLTNTYLKQSFASVSKGNLKDKFIFNENKAKTYENYLQKCFPTISLMKNSMIYNLDLDNINIKKAIASLTSKSNEMNYVSIIGRVPEPRDGHSVNVYRNFLVVFGGDRNKLPFNDLYTFIL